MNAEEKLLRAADAALECLEVIARTGHPAQGGEQKGNAECCEIAYANLKWAVEAYRAEFGIRSGS